MSYTSGHFFRRPISMARTCDRNFFRPLILALSALCLWTTFQETNNVCSARARRTANAYWEAQGRENPLRLRTDIVTLSVSVTDKQNNFVPGLGPQDFEVYEDGIKQDIAFFSDEDSPL